MHEIRQCFGTAPSGVPLAERLHPAIFGGRENAEMILAVLELGVRSRQLAADLERLLEKRARQQQREELRLIRGDAMLASTIGLTVVKGGLA